MGVWAASPNLPVKYTGESNAVLVVLNATLDVIDGGSFKYYGTYRQSSNGALISVRFSGRAVCADGYIDRVLLSIDGKSCWEAGGASWFCDSAPALYAGVFSYGVSPEGGLIINGWGGAQWPFQFSCASQSPAPPCQYATSCNSTVLNNWSLNLYGGTSVVNGTGQTVVISGGDNSTVIFEGDTINVQNSQFTLEQPTSVNQTIINISPEGNTYPTNTTVIIQPQNASFYEFNTNEAASCSGFAQLDGIKTSNVTLSTAANTRITFDSSSLESPSDWSLSPDSSTIQFNSDSGYAYSLQVCLQSALLYSPSPLGQRLMVYLYNRTGGSPSAISLPATSAVIYNHTDPAFLGGLCTGPILVPRLYNGNRFAVYATIQFTDFSSGTLILGPSAWTLTASPVACVGTEINIDITAEFNETQLEVGDCLDISFPSTKRIKLDNPGMCGPEDTDTVTWEEVSQGIWRATCTGTRTNGTSCAGLCGIRSSSSYITTSVDVNRTAVVGFEGVGSLPDTPTIDWTQTSTGVFEGQVRSVTANGLTCPGLCNAQSSSPYVTATVSGRNLTLGFTGVGSLQNTDTITCTQVSPRIFACSVTLPSGQNVSECVTCGNNTLTVRDNVTLNVKRLCAEQQCEVRSDPPTDTPSPGGQWRPNYCIFGCGDGDGNNDDGSDGDGDDGGGFAVIPPILPPPLFPPLFPPILPVGPPGGGSTGSSSSPNGPPGGDPNSPGAVYPITTYLPPGADPPVVEGGTWVPIVNFSQAVPYCGADSNPSRLGNLVLDISVQPSQLYLCQVVANGSYAWMPYCPCQLGAANNRTYYYYNTTTLWRDNSTVLISNTSQLINTGATYLGGPVFIAGPIVLTNGSSMDTCNASLVKMAAIEGCDGAPIALPDGVTISPPVGDAQGVGITKDGANFCPWESPPNVTARFQRIGSCGPGPGDAALYVDSPLETNAGINNLLNGIINCGASNSKLLTTNTIRNCDGVSPVDFPQGIKAPSIGALNASATISVANPTEFLQPVTICNVASSLSIGSIAGCSPGVGPTFTSAPKLPNFVMTSVLADLTQNFYEERFESATLPMRIVDSGGNTCNGQVPLGMSAYLVRIGAIVYGTILSDIDINAFGFTDCIGAAIIFDTLPVRFHPLPGWQSLGTIYAEDSGFPLTTAPPTRSGTTQWQVWAGKQVNSPNLSGIWFTQGGSAISSSTAYQLKYPSFVYTSQLSSF